MKTGESIFTYYRLTIRLLTEQFGTVPTGKTMGSPSVFIKFELEDGTNWPAISSHMLIANMKRNLKTLLNNDVILTDLRGDALHFRISEIFTFDIRVLEDFMIPSKDIIKDENGPILGRIGHRSGELLPKGTEYSCTLMIRDGGLITEEGLTQLLKFGKTNGIGRGNYIFKLERLPNNPEYQTIMGDPPSSIDIWENHIKSKKRKEGYVGGVRVV